MTLKERYAAVLEAFRREMPVAETELHYESPYQLLVAVILSAQCTDKRVNLITPALFEAYPSPEALSRATQQEVFGYIRSCSYPNNKARSLTEMAKMLVSEYGGEVPSTMEELLRLPGVGRKTANVMLSVIFDRPAMAVDTHVFRVAERIGLTYRSRTPLQTEQTLVRHIPEADIPRAHHWLILHGRYVCKARRPECTRCFLTEACRYYANTAKTTTKPQQTAKP